MLLCAMQNGIQSTLGGMALWYDSDAPALAEFEHAAQIFMSFSRADPTLGWKSIYSGRSGA
jgi:hypothetical protein